MFFRLDMERTVQAAAVLLRAQRGQQMSSLRLLTLLYRADRENLRAVARPIVGHKVVARDEGPVHGEVSSLIDGEHPDASYWLQHIQKDGYVVHLIDDPGVLDLSQQEIQTLISIADEHRGRDDWELARLAQEFPEWKKYHIANAAQEIPVSDILDAVGWTPADKVDILEEFEDEERLERLLHQNQMAAGR